jgi:hypothetical protein
MSRRSRAGQGETDQPGRETAREPQGLRPARGLAVAQIRGVLAERVVISTMIDPYLPLKALASYSGLSVRKLRDYLEDPRHPLPCYPVGGKILVRKSEFDTWIVAYRQHGRRDVDAIVNDVLRDLQPRYTQ